jgi:hypothetical protein
LHSKTVFKYVCWSLSTHVFRYIYFHLEYFQKHWKQPSRVAHACNHQPPKGKAAGSWVQDQPGLHHKTMSKKSKQTNQKTKNSDYIWREDSIFFLLWSLHYICSDLLFSTFQITFYRDVFHPSV